MIIKHSMREKHQNADSLSKKSEFYERLEQKQANQAEIKEEFSFLNNETYKALPLTRWLDKCGHPIPGQPELPVEKVAEIKILSENDPVPLDLLLRSNLVQQELSRMSINSRLSLMDKMVQVTPQVTRMLVGLLESEVTRDDPEWAAAMASLTVSEKVKIKPPRRQHKENERDCRTIVQQLVSSMPQNVSTSTSYKRKERVKGTQRKTVTFENQDQKGEEAEQNLWQESLSREKDVEENRRVDQQDPGQKILSGESGVEGKVQGEDKSLLRWMSSAHKTDPEKETCSVADSSIDDNSRNSGIYTYSDRNSSIVASKRRKEDKVLYKYNAIVLPQFYSTKLLFA